MGLIQFGSFHPLDTFGGQLVSLATLRTEGHPFFIEMEAMAIFTDPTDLLGGIADHQCVGWYIFGDDCSGTNEGVGSNLMTADDRCIGTNGGPSSDMGGEVLVPTADRTARVEDIRENTTGTQEYILLTNHTRIDGDVVLHLDIPTQCDSGRDHHILTNVALGADVATAHDMRKVPDARSRSNGTSGIHDGRLVDLIGWLRFHCYHFI